MRESTKAAAVVLVDRARRKRTGWLFPERSRFSAKSLTQRHKADTLHSVFLHLVACLLACPSFFYFFCDPGLLEKRAEQSAPMSSSPAAAICKVEDSSFPLMPQLNL